MKKSYLNDFKRKYPFSFIPFLFGLPNKSNPEYKETLNSLSLRHPDRAYLKSIFKKLYLMLSKLKAKIKVKTKLNLKNKLR